MIRVAIVDDHSIARRGLEALMSEAPDITVTGTGSAWAEASSSALTMTRPLCQPCR
jgi:DNA-binding NarL/FixJ family response regulator